MLRDVEKAKVHTGPKSDWLLNMMRTSPEYLDAIATEEQNVIAFNQDRTGLREPMVAIYPRDGTEMATHPFAILEGAPWVSPDQVKAAEIFRNFLLSPQQQSLLVRYGMRPADPAAPLGSPIERAYGANPGADIVSLEMPDPVVFDQVIRVWHQVKKPAQIVILFDKSTGMAGQKMSQAIGGAKAFVNAMDPNDWLAWVPFDDKVYVRTEGLKKDIGEQLLGDISSTTAGNGNSLYDAVSQTLDVLENQRKTQGNSVRYGIVVLSDGKDTSSNSASLDKLVERLLPSVGDPTGIQIHTIGIGDDADDVMLKKIADLGNGKYWKVRNSSDVVAAYKTIATYY